MDWACVSAGSLSQHHLAALVKKQRREIIPPLPLIASTLISLIKRKQSETEVVLVRLQKSSKQESVIMIRLV